MSWGNSKNWGKSSKFFSMKKKERRYQQYGILLLKHDAENLGLEHEAKPCKESTMDQVLDISNRVYKIATYSMRRVCHIWKLQCEKTAYIQIRLFKAKEIEGLKQVACVKYTLNEIYYQKYSKRLKYAFIKF